MEKYDLEAMNFIPSKAKAYNLLYAFIWEETPEGSKYWFKCWFDGKIPESEWKTKIDAVIKQWKQENG